MSIDIVELVDTIVRDDLEDLAYIATEIKHADALRADMAMHGGLDEVIAHCGGLDEFIAHYGVLGMKWGIRKDRRREDSKSKSENASAKTKYRRDKTPIGQLSDDEIRHRLERIRLEDQLRQALKTPAQKRRDKAKEAVGRSLGKTGSKLLDRAVNQLAVTVINRVIPNAKLSPSDLADKKKDDKKKGGSGSNDSLDSLVDTLAGGIRGAVNTQREARKAKPKKDGPKDNPAPKPEDRSSGTTPRQSRPSDNPRRQQTQSRDLVVRDRTYDYVVLDDGTELWVPY